MLIDTHAHLNFEAFEKDREEVIKRCFQNDILVINVGTNYETSKKAVEIAEKHEKGVYAAIGLHPILAQEGFDREKYKELAQSSGVKAIGEIGLDYKEEYISFKEKQKKVFLEQVALAKELNLPIIFHCRIAHDDLIEVLKSEIRNSKSETPKDPDKSGPTGQANSKSQIPNPKLRGVVHCFTGSWAQAEKYLKMGLYLGFNGIIFKMNLDDVIKKTPLEKILIETDCPYLTPLPAVASAEAGAQPSTRNEPLYVKYIAEKIAKIKNLSDKEIAKIITENAKKLFNLSKVGQFEV